MKSFLPFPTAAATSVCALLMMRSHPLADWCRGPLSSLLVEPEVGQVVVLHDVGLRLQPHFAGAFGLGFAARLDEIRIADDFRADEALLDVRVNGAAGFPGRGALPNRPGAVFLAANGQETDVA